MNKSKFFRALICFWTIVLTWSGSFADTEIRTLQSWNLPHPYQGPKSLTENVFAFLVNPAVRDFAQKQGMEINYSKEDDCLLVSGNDKALNVVGGTLSQLRGYGHPYGDLLAPEDVKIGATSAFKFKKICSVEGGKNLLRLEMEYLPAVPKAWEKPVRYGMRGGTYETLGTFEFPVTVTGAKAREIEGELQFQTKVPGQSIHALSYRGMSKADLREKLNNSADQASIYMDVPYKQLLNTDSEQGAQWALYRAGSRAIKLMCPNYRNPRMTALFKDQQFRQILQKIVDLQYHMDAVGITDTGLQPTDENNLLDFHSWRPYAASAREKVQQQILNEWKTWIAGKDRKTDKQFEDYFYIEGGQLFDAQTEELPKVKVFFADNINDQRFFDNLKKFLIDNRIIDLEVNGRNDFITSDRFRLILAGQERLLDGQEGVVFDIPVPYNDHIESYFVSDQNFFGLSKEISAGVVRQAEDMTQGQWELDSTKTLGRLLRTECPCLAIGEHPFYVYTRKSEDHELKSVQFPASAPTAYRLAERIRATSRD